MINCFSSQKEFFPPQFSPLWSLLIGCVAYKLVPLNYCQLFIFSNNSQLGDIAATSAPLPVLGQGSIRNGAAPLVVTRFKGVVIKLGVEE